MNSCSQPLALFGGVGIGNERELPHCKAHIVCNPFNCGGSGPGCLLCHGKLGADAGDALAHDRPLSRWPHACGGGRSRSAQRLLRRPGRRRGLEVHRLRPHLESDLRWQDTQSIGAIAVAPSDSNVVYVASGEGLHRPDLSVGDGIYRSADAGRTWTHLGLRDGQQIPALAVDPTQSQSAVRRGAGPSLRTESPSAASSARRMAARPGKRSSTRTRTPAAPIVAIDPKNPQIVYAALWDARLGPWEDKNSTKERTAASSSRPTAATPGSN